MLREPDAAEREAEVIDVAASPLGLLTLLYSGPVAAAEAVVEPLAFSVGVDMLTALGLPEDVALDIMNGVLPLQGAMDALETWASAPAVVASDQWFLAPVQLRGTLPAAHGKSGFENGRVGGGRGGGGGGSF